MCKHDAESVNHLLLHCDVARELGSLILAMFGMEWVFSRTVGDVLYSWRGAKVGRRKKAWCFAPFAVMWITWGEQNRRTFEGKEMPTHKLKSNILSFLYSWLYGLVDPSLNQFLDFIDALK